MKLLTYLMGINVPTLRTIASRVGHLVPENSKQRLASGIIQKLTRRKSLEIVLNNLTDGAHALLRFVLLRQRQQWHVRDLACFRNVWSEPEIFQGVSELVNSGFLGVSYDREEDRDVHFTFPENEGILREILGLETTDPLKSLTPPSQVHSHPRAWKTDLITLLGHCARNDVRLTKKDLPHQRAVKTLDPLLVGSRIREIFERLCQLPFHWIERLTECLQSIGSVSARGPRIALAPRAFERLLAKIDADFVETFALSGLGGREQSVESDVLDVLATVHRAQARDRNGGECHWRSVEAFKDSIYPTRDFFPPSSFPRTVEATLFGLMVSGEVDLGESPSGWSWRPRGPRDDSSSGTRFLHVQPNYEVLTAFSLPYSERCVLEQLADLVAVDEQLMHYRISRDSVYRGLCGGWTSEKQVEWYKSQVGQGPPLPQNVSHSIESWGVSFGRLSLEHPLLLVCDEARFAEELYHSSEIAHHCLGRFSENTVLIEPDAADEVLRALRGMGFLPNPEVGNGLRWAIEVRKPPEGGD